MVVTVNTGVQDYKSATVKMYVRFVFLQLKRSSMATVDIDI